MPNIRIEPLTEQKSTQAKKSHNTTGTSIPPFDICPPALTTRRLIESYIVCLRASIGLEGCRCANFDSPAYLISAFEVRSWSFVTWKICTGSEISAGIFATLPTHVMPAVAVAQAPQRVLLEVLRPLDGP